MYRDDPTGKRSAMQGLWAEVSVQQIWIVGQTSWISMFVNPLKSPAQEAALLPRVVSFVSI